MKWLCRCLGYMEGVFEVDADNKHEAIDEASFLLEDYGEIMEIDCDCEPVKEDEGDDY